MASLVARPLDTYARQKRVQKFRVFGIAKSTAVNARGDVVNDSTNVTYADVTPIYVGHLTDRPVGSCKLYRTQQGIAINGIVALDENLDAEVIATLPQYRLSIGSRLGPGEDLKPVGLAGRRTLRNLHIIEISLTKEPADAQTSLRAERIY